MGMAIMSILAGFRMEYNYRKLKLLESVIEDKEIQLVKLGDSMNKHKYILKGIEVYLAYDGDDLDKIAMEKYIKEKYRPLLGKKIGDIDMELAVEVIDKRIVKLDPDKEFRLNPTRVILTEILKIWVEADLLD